MKPCRSCGHAWAKQRYSPPATVPRYTGRLAIPKGPPSRRCASWRARAGPSAHANRPLPVPAHRCRRGPSPVQGRLRHRFDDGGGSPDSWAGTRLPGGRFQPLGLPTFRWSGSSTRQSAQGGAPARKRRWGAIPFPSATQVYNSPSKCWERFGVCAPSS